MINGAESVLSAGWIKKRLSSDAELVALVGGIFTHSVPKGAAFPYVVITEQSPVIDAWKLATMTFNISVYGDPGTAYRSLAQIQARIFEVLQLARGRVEEGDLVLKIADVRRRTGVPITPNLDKDGRNFPRLGNLYTVTVA